MYRIFRGKHLLILASSDEDHSAYQPDFVFKKPTEEQIKEMLSISKSSTKALIIILVDKPKKLLKRIKSEFKLVEAAGGLVFNHKDEILAIKRLGKWDLPKGKLKKGENIESCAMREVEEETGASGLSIVDHLTETYHTYYRYNKWHLKKTYWYIMDCKKHKNLVPQAEEDIEEAKWFKFKKLNPEKLDTYPAIKWILQEYKNFKN
ncbi:MAG: NUDIX domain-containing protein [Bacteroidia bacterium]